MGGPREAGGSACPGRTLVTRGCRHVTGGDPTCPWLGPAMAGAVAAAGSVEQFQKLLQRPDRCGAPGRGREQWARPCVPYCGSRPAVPSLSLLRGGHLRLPSLRAICWGHAGVTSVGPSPGSPSRCPLFGSRPSVPSRCPLPVPAGRSSGRAGAAAAPGKNCEEKIKNPKLWTNRAPSCSKAGLWPGYGQA